jgi:hypothetical protein
MTTASWIWAATESTSRTMSDSKSGPARFDSIFPTQWSDCLNDFFVDVTLERLPGVADAATSRGSISQSSVRG